LACCLAASLILGMAGATAQVPDGPVRILVGFPPGGTIDTVARILADKMREDLGVTVVVENRTGAGGQLAAQALRQEAPDGRTQMIAAHHTLVIIPLTMRSPGYDPVADFQPVGPVASYVGALAV